MKAIIPAAGYGTRMLPITKTIPKEMLPIGNKPVIQYIVEGFASAGIENIGIITSQGKSALEDYFGKNYELEEKLKLKNKPALLAKINKPKDMANYVFFRQEEQLGLPHAIAQARYWMDDDFFFVTVCDQFGEKAIYQGMIDLFKKTRQPIVKLARAPLKDVSKYGVADVQNGEIVDLVEKPAPEDAPSNLICQGLYILPREFFQAIDETPINESNGEVVIPDVLLRLRTMGFKLIPYISDYSMWDMGGTDLWLKANNEMAARNWEC